MVPGISIERDTSPEQSGDQTNDQPAVLRINGVLRIPAELSHFTHKERWEAQIKVKTQNYKSEPAHLKSNTKGSHQSFRCSL